MKYFLYLFLGLQLFSSGVFAQDWVEFRSPEGRFSIKMPAKPESSTQTLSSELVSYTTNLFISKTTNDIFIVGWVDYDSSFKFDTRAELLANRDNFVTALKATLGETKDISYKGYPGIEFTATTEHLYINSRVFVANKRPYQLVAISKTGAPTPDLEKFFFSFVLEN